VLEMAMVEGIKGDGSGISKLEPLLAVEPPTVIGVGAEELQMWYDLPKDWRKMYSLKHFAIRSDQLRAARLEKRAAKLEGKAALKEKRKQEQLQARVEKNSGQAKRVSKPKKKAKAKAKAFGLLPPGGHRIECYWPTGGAGGWYETTFVGTEEGADGGMISVIENDGVVEKNLHA
jgi:hypothetical protein